MIAWLVLLVVLLVLLVLVLLLLFSLLVATGSGGVGGVSRVLLFLVVASVLLLIVVLTLVVLLLLLLLKLCWWWCCIVGGYCCCCMPVTVFGLLVSLVFVLLYGTTVAHTVWFCNDHKTIFLFSATAVEAWTLAVSKDDKLLASGTQKGSVNLWALDGHKKASAAYVLATPVYSPPW